MRLTFSKSLQRLRLGRPADEELLLRLYVGWPGERNHPLYGPLRATLKTDCSSTTEERVHTHLNIGHGEWKRPLRSNPSEKYARSENI
jgi:hypothetical protein